MRDWPESANSTYSPPFSVALLLIVGLFAKIVH
jgi:hypothetical protein